MRTSVVFAILGVVVLLLAGLAMLSSLRKSASPPAADPGTEAATAAGAASGEGLFPALAGKLVVPAEGGGFETFAIDPAKAPRYLAVYFSAHWCGPCQVFTPELVKFYDAAKARGGDFELIFVSSDTGEKAMHGYMTEAGMKFPALKYSERGTTEVLTRLAGPGIPCLVVLDAKGSVLAHSFDGDRYLGPEVAMRELQRLLERRS